MPCPGRILREPQADGPSVRRQGDKFHAATSRSGTPGRGIAGKGTRSGPNPGCPDSGARSPGERDRALARPRAGDIEQPAKRPPLAVGDASVTPRNRTASLRTMNLSPRATTALVVLSAAALCYCAVEIRRLRLAVDALEARDHERSAAWATHLERQATELATIGRDITRMRVEQRVGGQGPHALLEMLRAHAATLVDARATQPDFQNAQEQMRSVLRAFGALGADGIGPLRKRFESLDPAKDFDEMRWLLEALVQCDTEGGVKTLVGVVEGRIKPNPRLRWAASELLTRTDKPLAQTTLRRVLLTETSRGIDTTRAAAYGASIPDPAATAATGFFNFVLHYLRTEDPETEETLLQVLMRTEQDVATLQETIEALGARKSARARKRIEELYLKPPGASQNPLFLNKCLDALVAIRGEESRPWLQEQLATAAHEMVSQHIGYLLEQLK